MYFKKGDIILSTGWCQGIGEVESVRKSRSYYNKSRQYMTVAMRSYSGAHKVNGDRLMTDNRFARLLTPVKSGIKGCNIKDPTGRKIAIKIKRTK